MDVKELVPKSSKMAWKNSASKQTWALNLGTKPQLRPFPSKFGPPWPQETSQRSVSRLAIFSLKIMSIGAINTAEFDLLEEGQLDLSEHLSDSHGQLTWGGKEKEEEEEEKFLGWSHESCQKGCKFRGCRCPPKSGLSIEVSGTALPISPSLKTGFLSHRGCRCRGVRRGVCFSISETILKLPKK